MCTFTFLDELDNRQWTQQRLAGNAAAILFTIAYMRNRPHKPQRRCALFSGYVADKRKLIGTATMCPEVFGDVLWTPKGMELFTGLETYQL